MKIHQPHIRSFVVIAVFLVSLATSACAQEKAKRLLGDSSGANALALMLAQSPSSLPQEGTVSVTYGDVYQRGSLKVESYDLASLPPLPRGYAALDGKAYLITTTAVVSGPHVIHFKTASVTDEKVFGNLRIFHAEPDAFDPDSPIWFDRTILSPETPAPEFSGKTIHASSDELGVFVIGKLVQSITPSTAVADLAVTCTSSPEKVTSPNEITYLAKVVNNGPQTASDVGLMNGLSPDGILVSVTSSQGTCQEREGNIYCKLGVISVGASATVKVIIKPYEGAGSFPVDGKAVFNSVLVGGKEGDNSLENNTAGATTLVFPDPNLPPTVTIDEPKPGALFVGPANITIKATAIDRDGIVSKVAFFDNGKMIGSGIPSEDNRLVITERDVSFGSHSIIAVATDNGGRQGISYAANFTVNGSAVVNILKPTEGTLIAPGSDIRILARATHPSGVIKKVEFFANWQSLGEGARLEADRYELKWGNLERGAYSITAVATDGSEITTTTPPVTMTVTKPPSVIIVNPKEGSSFPPLYNINITAKATQPEGTVERVDFYSDGVLIGSAHDISTDRFMMTWRRLPDGAHSLTAIATNEFGVTSKSDPVRISVGRSKPER